MNEQLNALQQQLAALQQQQAQPAPQATGWNAPAASGPAALIQGVSVPISVETPAGKIRCQLWLPAELGQNPQMLMNALQQLQAAGYPLDIWQGKQDAGNGWNNGNNGGWNSGGNRGYGNGGGYNRGGYGGRRW